MFYLNVTCSSLYFRKSLVDFAISAFKAFVPFERADRAPSRSLSFSPYVCCLVSMFHAWVPRLGAWLGWVAGAAWSGKEWSVLRRYVLLRLTARFSSLSTCKG